MSAFSGLPPAAVVFLIAQVSAVGLVLLALLIYLLTGDPWVRRQVNRKRSRLPILKASHGSSAGNPILCSVPDCRRCGEIFLDTRLGTLMFCRLHARKLREQLDRYFQTMEQG